MEGKEEQVKLWNKNFFLLWQGQMVSFLGNVIYTIALDFWILDITGSTSLMGLLSAISMIPTLVIGPIAGVFVDKWDRKKIIVITDFVRGIFVTFVGIASLMGFIQVWMVFVVAILNGVCAAFFNPCINSVRPDIVDKSLIVKANSVTTLAQSGMDMLGSAIGGILYVTFGATYMFLFNGISFLFSAFTELFLFIPKVKRESKKLTFKEDFKEGFNFLWNLKILRNLVIAFSFINFFFNAAFILTLPYFKETDFLGPERYGVAMAVISFSMIVGSILLSVKSIESDTRYKVFIMSSIVMAACFPFITILSNYYVILALLFTAFFFNIILNTIFTSIIMMVIPDDKRGKVFSILNTIMMSLSPIGMFLGGVLGDILSIRLAMTILLIIGSFSTLTILFIKDLKKLVNFDVEKNNVLEFINK